jgi:lipopolysaccharide biosynthesis glycosyltransferase
MLVKMNTKKNKSKLSKEDEEFSMINISNSRNSDNPLINSNDYLTLRIKTKNIEIIFALIFIILLLFLILSGIFEKKTNSNIHLNVLVKYRNYINVAYAFDSSYQYITHVSMKSIMLSQNRDTFIIFHIMVSSKIKNEEKEVIDKISKEYKNCEIKYYYMGNRFKEINVKAYITWSTAMYYRLRLPDLLPNEKRVLYLDCDTLVYKDLTDLYNYNIEGKYFTGMLEPRDLSYLGLNVNNYINTGVMLFNLDELRKDDVAKKIEEFLIKHNYRLLFPVNDSVNTVCHKKNGYFSPEYVQWGLCNENFVNKYIDELSIKLDKKEVLKAYKDPYIYHMIGYKYKPWNGIPNYQGTVCIDPIARFYEMAKKTDYYYNIIEEFKIYRPEIVNK